MARIMPPIPAFQQEFVAPIDPQTDDLDFDMTDFFRLTVQDDPYTDEVVINIEIPFQDGPTVKQTARLSKVHVQAVGGIVLERVFLGDNTRVVRAKKGEF